MDTIEEEITRDNFMKIVIVGGGSSGWITASALIRYFPSWDITLVESKRIPTIGVGESTTAMMKHFINGHLGIPDEEFLPGVDGIYKMAVKFTDFYYEGDKGFYYPFGKPELDDLGSFGIESWDIVKAFNPDLPRQDFIKSLFPTYELFNNNKMNDNLFGEVGSYRPDIERAYHLDANKLGSWLRDNYCIPRGVNHIWAEVSDVVKTNDGIESIILSDGEKINADFFVDCSGFKSILLSKIMNPEFVDVSHMLSNNRAWAVPTQYKDKHKEMIPYTSSTALKNGWAWYTPIWSRVGNGYAYSDQFTTPQEALAEFKEYLISNKTPLDLSAEEVEDLPFFELRMKAGYYKEGMVQNVAAIGLSGGFLEPLEGTGLYFVSEAALSLVKCLQRNNQFSRDSFNMYMENLYKEWVAGLCIFYAQTDRDDSQYWKNIKNKSFLTEEDNSEFIKYMKRGMTDSMLERSSFDIWSAVSHGTDFFNRGSSVVDRWQTWDSHVDYKQISEHYKNIFNNRKNKWKSMSESSLNAYEYLKRKIYKDYL
jgi:tryptophan halogenase